MGLHVNENSLRSFFLPGRRRMAMSRPIIASTIGLHLCFAVSLALAVERGGGAGERSAGRQSPGGAWSPRTHQGGNGHTTYDQSHGESRNSGQTGFGAEHNRQNKLPSSANGAAAGAAAANRNQPAHSGAEGAAAGAAAANR